MCLTWNPEGSPSIGGLSLRPLPLPLPRPLLGGLVPFSPPSPSTNCFTSRSSRSSRTAMRRPPSSVPLSSFTALMASSGVSNSTMPQPLERPVTRRAITQYGLQSRSVAGGTAPEIACSLPAATVGAAAVAASAVYCVFLPASQPLTACLSLPNPCASALTVIATGNIGIHHCATSPESVLQVCKKKKVANQQYHLQMMRPIDQQKCRL